MPEPTLRTVEVLNCPQCGMPLAAEAKKCGQCGRDLSNYPRSAAAAQVGLGARFATYLCGIFWILSCFAWAWSYLSNYLQGNFFPPTLNDRDHMIYILSAIVSAVIILFLTTIAIGMMRYKKGSRNIARIFSWLGSAIGTLSIFLTLILPMFGEGFREDGPWPTTPSAMAVFAVACALTFFSFLTRWAIRQTKELEN